MAVDKSFEDKVRAFSFNLCAVPHNESEPYIDENLTAVSMEVALAYDGAWRNGAVPKLPAEHGFGFEGTVATIDLLALHLRHACIHCAINYMALRVGVKRLLYFEMVGANLERDFLSEDLGLVRWDGRVVVAVAVVAVVANGNDAWACFFLVSPMSSVRITSSGIAC